MLDEASSACMVKYYIKSDNLSQEARVSLEPHPCEKIMHQLKLGLVNQDPRPSLAAIVAKHGHPNTKPIATN